MRIRVPADLKAYVAELAKRYGSSMNYEIVRALRERQAREAVKNEPATSAG